MEWEWLLLLLAAGSIKRFCLLVFAWAAIAIVTLVATIIVPDMLLLWLGLAVVLIFRAPYELWPPRP